MSPASPDPALSLLIAAADSEERLRLEFRRVLAEELRMTVRDFCKAARLPASTVYKLTSADREPSLPTLRAVVAGVRRVSRQRRGPFVAVVAARAFVHEATTKEPPRVPGGLPIREFPVTTMEDALVAAIQAERAGAVAVVCAPILAPTLERVLTVPVVEIAPKGAIREAVGRALRRAAK